MKPIVAKASSEQISRIVDTYKQFLQGGGKIEKYAHRAGFEEIEKNEKVKGGNE